MANIKRPIMLSAEERETLLKFVSIGTQPVRLVRRAEIILALDCSGDKVPLTESQIAANHNVSRQTVQIAKQDFLSWGIEEFLHRKKRETPPVPAKVDGDLEAHIIALCCGELPKGYARWSVRLLADQCVELGYIDSISHMTISRTLKKTNLSLT